MIIIFVSPPSHPPSCVTLQNYEARRSSPLSVCGSWSHSVFRCVFGGGSHRGSSLRYRFRPLRSQGPCVRFILLHSRTLYIVFAIGQPSRQLPILFFLFVWSHGHQCPRFKHIFLFVLLLSVPVWSLPFCGSVALGIVHCCWRWWRLIRVFVFWTFIQKGDRVSLCLWAG